MSELQICPYCDQEDPDDYSKDWSEAELTAEREDPDYDYAGTEGEIE